MDENSLPFTIEQFYKFISEGRVAATQCMECGAKFLPPRPICTKCYSKKLRWIYLEPKGKLVTYTVIYVAPPRFQHLTPYAYGIIEFERGLRLPGIIRMVDSEDLKVGMELEMVFDSSPSNEWPMSVSYTHLTLPTKA